MKKNCLVNFIVLVSILLLSCKNQSSGSESHKDSAVDTVVSKDETDTETSISDYQEIGPINVYNYVSGYDADYMHVEKNTLYVKTLRGSEFFYVSLKSYDEEKFPVEKGEYEEGGEWFNGRIETGELTVYVNIPLWGEVSRKTSKGDEVNEEETKPQRIVVEHHRDPQPVQEYVQCNICFGSGKCMTCNGTGENLYTTNYHRCNTCGGSGRCTYCAGQGGHYETRYR